MKNKEKVRMSRENNKAKNNMKNKNNNKDKKKRKLERFLCGNSNKK